MYSNFEVLQILPSRHLPTYYLPCSIVSIVNFEKVNANWIEVNGEITLPRIGQISRKLMSSHILRIDYSSFDKTCNVKSKLFISFDPF